MKNIDWSMLSTKASRDKKEVDEINARLSAKQDSWRSAEMAFIADQLIAIEDGAEDALPGTDAQWRAYRTLVRNWKEGAEGYPFEENAPQRPTGKA